MEKSNLAERHAVLQAAAALAPKIAASLADPANEELALRLAVKMAIRLLEMVKDEEVLRDFLQRRACHGDENGKE